MSTPISITLILKELRLTNKEERIKKFGDEDTNSLYFFIRFSLFVNRQSHSFTIGSPSGASTTNFTACVFFKSEAKNTVCLYRLSMTVIAAVLG